MSAFLSNPEDIKAVVHWAEANGLLPDGLDRATTAKAIGRVNLESVAYRYPDIAWHVAPAFLDMSDQEYLQEITEPFEGTPLLDHHAAQLIGSIEYQSCERPDWKDSPVKRWLEAWEAHAERPRRASETSVIRRLQPR